MYIPKEASAKLPGIAVSGPYGICGWGGIALNAAAVDPRIKATVASTMYEDAPFFVKDYYSYYKTPRGYHKRSLNSNGGWAIQNNSSWLNAKFLQYTNEIRNAVMIVHGDKAHSYYFGKDAYENMIKDNKYTNNKKMLTIPGAVHTDLYDNVEVIPFDEIEKFFIENLK